MTTALLRKKGMNHHWSKTEDNFRTYHNVIFMIFQILQDHLRMLAGTVKNNWIYPILENSTPLQFLLLAVLPVDLLLMANYFMGEALKNFICGNKKTIDIFVGDYFSVNKCLSLDTCMSPGGIIHPN